MNDFANAKLVAWVFLAEAIVIVVVTVVSIAAYVVSHGQFHRPTSTSPWEVKVLVAAAVMVGAILVASWVAFFGYVLLLLVAVHRELTYLSRRPT